jgi:hypothetical protein
MGFFDRLAGKTPAPVTGTEVEAQAPVGAEPSAGIAPRLALARERLDLGDLPGAMAVYEEVLEEAGERADVLVTISGDLGSTGHIPEIIELVAPRYDALRHGPATGINLVQAYLAVRDRDAAQHVLDILFSLNRPELEARLHGFSNAVAELIQTGAVTGVPNAGKDQGPLGIALVTLSRPIWAYGLESIEEALPRKDGKLRRVAFTQFALPEAYPDPAAAAAAGSLPEDELGLLSRAIPLWLAETFYFSQHYSPVPALGCMHTPDGVKRPAIFTEDWTIENLRKLAETTQGGLDYIFAGSLRSNGTDYALEMRVWEVKKFRERKQITVRWTAATADAELLKLQEYLRAFMEWAPYPEGEGVPYSPPGSPTAWIQALGALLGLFFVEKGLMPRDQLPPLSPVFDAFGPHAFTPPSSSLAWVTLRRKALAAGLGPPLGDVLLSRHPAVAKALALIGT